MSAISEAAIAAIVARIRLVYRGWGRGVSTERMRDDWDALFADPSGDATREAIDADGVPCCWVASPGVRSDRTVLYLHGGGFQVGSTVSHAGLMAAISKAAGCRVLGVDYRLAPEHAVADASSDVMTAYRWLCRLHGSSRAIVVAGDSAGGNLALTLSIGARDGPDGAAALPCALVLLSPWTDMTASGASYETRAAADPIHQRPMIQGLARACLGEALEASDPRASPLFACLSGLPPLLIQVGDRETLLSDATELADRARAAGVKVSLHVWDGMIHVFQQFPEELQEARDAIGAIGAFVAKEFDRS